MTTALITGGRGQDGRLLTALLLERGDRVVRAVSNPGAEDVEWPSADQAAIARLLEEWRPSEVYNLAAVSFSPDNWDRPLQAMDLNGTSFLRLLEAVRQVDPAIRVFQASSSEMFGRSEAALVDERHPLAPETLYGAAKAFAHRTAELYRQRYDLFVSCGILFPHESPLRSDRFLSQKVCTGAARVGLGLARELALGNLEAQRDWTAARDVVRGMHLALRYETPGDYVLASGRLRTVKELCAIAFQHVSRDWRDHVRVDEALVRAEPPGFAGDARHARQTLGWQPTISFEAMVQEMVDAARERLRAQEGGTGFEATTTT